MQEEQSNVDEWRAWMREASSILLEQERIKILELFRTLIALPLGVSQCTEFANYLWLLLSWSLESSLGGISSSMLETPWSETLKMTSPIVTDRSPRWFLDNQQEIVGDFARYMSRQGMVTLRAPSGGSSDLSFSVPPEAGGREIREQEIRERFRPVSFHVERLLQKDHEFWNLPSRGECLENPESDKNCLPPAWRDR